MIIDFHHGLLKSLDDIAIFEVGRFPTVDAESIARLETFRRRVQALSQKYQGDSYASSKALLFARRDLTKWRWRVLTKRMLLPLTLFAMALWIPAKDPSEREGWYCWQLVDRIYSDGGFPLLDDSGSMPHHLYARLTRVTDEVVVSEHDILSFVDLQWIGAPMQQIFDAFRDTTTAILARAQTP